MPLGTCMVFYTEGPFSKQASFVFPRRANWLAFPLAAVVSSAELGLLRERKLWSGSVQRLPGSGWSSAEVLDAPSKCFFLKPAISAAVSAPQSKSSFTRWSSSKKRTFAICQLISIMGEVEASFISSQASSKLFRIISQL